MFQVAGFSFINGKKFYAVYDIESAEPEYEIISEQDIITLVKFAMNLYDPSGEKIELQNGVLTGSVPYVDSSDDGEGESDEYEELEFDEYDEDDDLVSEEYEEEVGYDDSEDDDSEDEGDLVDEDEGEYVSEEEDEYDELVMEEDDEDEEASTVSKLYAYLNKEQIIVLKRYYLWFSQRLFTDAQKDPTLGMKDKNALKRKQQNLENLRNTGGLWHYAGFVDMGRKGEGYCTLGHPLRYMHLAWDVTYSDIETAFFGQDYDADFEEAIESNNCIVFGIKCISDFFEVSKDCTLALQRAQRESLKDMASMYQYYEARRQEEVMNTFGLMDALVKATRGIDARGALAGGDYQYLLKPELASFYKQFREVRMIPPKSMIQELRDCILGWTSHKFTGTLNRPNSVIYKRFLQSIVRKDQKALFDSVDMSYIDGSYSSDLRTGYRNFAFTMLAYKSCGWYEYNADTSKDEGGASKTVKAALSNLYGGAIQRVFNDVEYTIDYFKKLTDVMMFFSRFSRYNDTEYFVYTKSNRGIEDARQVSLFEWNAIEDSGLDTYGNQELFDAIKFVRQTGSTISSYTRWSQIDAIGDAGKKIDIDRLCSVTNWAASILDRDLDAFKEYTRARYEKKEEEEMTESGVPTTVEEILDYLNGADLGKLDDGEYGFAKKVYTTVKESGKAPSSKQLYHIKNLYKALSGREFETKVGVDKEELTPEKLNILKEIVRFPAKYGFGENDFGLKVAKTVTEKGSASEKQMKWMNQLIEQYEKNK